MTSLTSDHRFGWRRAMVGIVAAGALTVGLLAGLGQAIATAAPDTDAAATETAEPQAAPKVMTADEALAIIASDYDTGAGGGQLSNLIHEVMTLRAQGFKASNANREAITKALEHRPNQAPLIEALQGTLMYQRKQQAQAANAVAPDSGFGAGIGQYPPGQQPRPGDPGWNDGSGVNPGISITPSGGGVQQPIG